MLNLIRADIYRVLRGKALYITLIVLLANCILMVISMNAFQTGVVTITMPEAVIDELVPSMAVTGVTTPQLIATQMENFVFFLLPVIVIVAGAIFSHGTVKNDIAWGVSRTKLYFSKLILSSVIGFLLMLVYIGFSTVIAMIINGYGGPAPAGHWISLLQIFSAQLLLLLAFIGVGVFLAFVTKRVAAVNGGFIAFIFVPLFILSMVVLINTNLEWLMEYEMLGNIMALAYLPYMETREILRALGIGAFFLVGSTIGGIALFRRSEIK
ncbi:MAG: ABC transporter permease [Defluviitaleaceae bacterium]|nr:ABC transporter permease [Defluviitaleaceae bacterium]